MRTSLQELKLLLLRQSKEIQNTIENGTAIINALKSLLKIAEMRNKCSTIDEHSFASQSNNRLLSPPLPIPINTDTSNENNQLGPSADSMHISMDDSPNYSSDIDPSGGEEDDTSEEFYVTANDGYEADVEIANSLTSDEFDDSDLVIKVKSPVTSRYRNHIVHEEICHIVVEILIDLSTQCLEEPDFWPSYLVQIAAGLVPIRESIGGSIYLIRGFTPVLSSNDVRLRDFQKSILDLITDIHTPETFSAYLSILTSGLNPPIEILLPRLIYLANQTYQIQPNAKINFPTINGN